MTPRALFAVARDGSCPPGSRGRIRSIARLRTPSWCNRQVGRASTRTFEQLAILANISTLVLYGMCCLATWELRLRDVRTGGVPFRVPMAGLVVAVAVLLIGWALSSVTASEWLAFSIALAVAWEIFLLRQRRG